MQPTTHSTGSFLGKLSAGILLSSAIAATLCAQPPDIARRVAERESEARDVRANYTYQQSVQIEELGKNDQRTGIYTETRDIIFSPTGERTEKFVKQPSNGLKRLKMTDEDFRDIRDVQPFLYTKEEQWLYLTKVRGEENVYGVDCWILEVTPRQILDGMRLFEGLIWVDKTDYSVVVSEGKAVPQILSMKSENLFPRFRTVRQKVDGNYWFPVLTIADDVLPFSNGPLHERMEIRYSNYKRFGAESTIKFDK